MLSEEPCQCPDCQRFYREHDRLIRESPTLRQQQELSWAALQAFRTLSGRVLEDLQKQHGNPSAEAQTHATSVGGGEERLAVVELVLPSVGEPLGDLVRGPLGVLILVALVAGIGCADDRVVYLFFP